MTAPKPCCAGSPRARIIGGIVGVNVGANKDSADRVADYVKLIETFAPVASYFTVNVSSPNTPGLRNLQQSAALDDLLAKVIDARERVRKNAGDSPVLLKIAPDLSLAELDDVVHIARSRRVDGMIVANTTLARPSTLREQNRAKEQGGLSGRPLFRLSTRMVAETYVRAEGAFPLIGVGGIDTGGAALTKIRAGASLIQLYSSLVYKGLGLVEDIKSDLASTLLRTGRDSLSEIVGADAATITAEDWPVSSSACASGSQHPERSTRCSSSRFADDQPNGGCTSERRPQQRRIAQRLKPAARGVVHQQRAPQSGIAERAQRQPRGEEDQQRQHHQIAHVARPGRADIDAVKGKGEHAEQRRDRSRTADSRARCAARPRSRS